MMMKKGWIVTASLFFMACGSSQDADNSGTADTKKNPGQTLFNNYCVQCHSLNEDKIGPKLSGALQRWDNDTARIAAFIRNAREARESGDPRAVKVHEEWNGALMTPMPHLTDNDINQLLEYIANGKD